MICHVTSPDGLNKTRNVVHVPILYYVMIIIIIIQFPDSLFEHFRYITYEFLVN